jgi:hypothetical protein
MSSHDVVHDSSGVYKLQALDRAFAVLDLLKGIQQDLGYTPLAR